MLIESAAPYSMAGVMFLVPYAISAPTAIAFGEVWGKMGVGYSKNSSGILLITCVFVVFISSDDHSPCCNEEGLGS